MINTSQLFSSKIAESTRQLSARLMYDTEEISGAIRSVQITSGACGEGNFTVGAVFSSYIEVVIDECEDALENKELLLQIGLLVDDETVEYVDIGYYTVTKPKSSVYSTTFTAVGRITSKLNEMFDVPSVLTLRNIADAITAATGVTIVFNGDVSDAVLAKDITGMTCKEALSVIAGTFGGFATEDNSGNIVVSKYNTDSKVPVNGDRMTALPEFNDYDYELNGIKVVVSAAGESEDGSAIEEVAFTEGTPRLTMTNEFMTAELFEKFVANTVGYKYRPGTVTLALGDPRLQPWDCLEVTDIKDNVYTAPCLNIVHTFDGGLTTTITAPGESESESSSSAAGPITQLIERMNYALITAQEAIVKRLKADELEAEVAKLGFASVKELNAINADITNLKAKDAEIEGTLTATKAEITDLKAKSITVENLSAVVATLGFATIDQLNATDGKIDNLTAKAITTDNLEANIADFGFITAGDLSANFATINLANVEAGSITQAMIGDGVVGSMQIADGSITDAKIVELAANKITAGTLSVERLEIRGSANSLVYALNDITGALQAQSVDTLNGEILTPRTITADRIVAESITADEIATNAITANKILAGAVTTEKISASAVTAGKIAAGAVTAETIAAGAVKSKAIEAGAITADKINVTDLFSQDITATGTITGVELIGAFGSFSGQIEASRGYISVFRIDDDGLSADLFENGTTDYSLTKSYFAASVFPEGATNNSERACYISAHALNSDGLGSIYINSTGNVLIEANGQIQFNAMDGSTGLVRITPRATDYVLTVAGKSSFAGDVSVSGAMSVGSTMSVSGTISENGKKLSETYVSLSTAQTITSVKTFNSSNVFNGEQKFSNASYCPSIYDTASGVGCAFKASRGLFNEALIDSLIMTSSAGKIPFCKYTGTSGGSMTGLTEVASINNAGALSCASVSASGAISGNTVTSTSSMTCGGIFTVNAGAIELFHSSTPYIDFHYGKSSADNTSRIIENQSGTLSVNGVYCTKGGNLKTSNLEVTGDKIYCKPSYDNTVTHAANMYVATAGGFFRTTNTSSRTIKHDIKALEDENLKAESLYDLEVVQFKYDEGIITDETDSRYGKDLPGFIIENMSEVYPIAVDKPSDDVKEWSWNPQYLIPPMLKLIQEQHKVDISHEGRIARAEAQIENLQEQLSSAMITIARQQKEIDSLRQAS